MSSPSDWPVGRPGRLPDASGLPPLGESGEQRNRPFRFGRTSDDGEDAGSAANPFLINGVRVPPSLEAELRRHKQETMVGPERASRRSLALVVPLVGVAMVVAGVGWAAFDRFSQTRNPGDPDRFDQVAAVAPTFNRAAGEQTNPARNRARDQVAAVGPLPAGTYGLARQEEAVPTQTEEEAVQPRTEVAALAPAAVPPEVVEPARQTIALAPPQSMPQESAPPASASPPPTPAPRQIDAEELEILKKQAADFIAAGDLISARRIFLRAAEARDAEAALAVGATYDPITIEQFGVRGLKGDIAKAREWYRKAEEFGSTMAAKRLELLAQRER